MTTVREFVEDSYKLVSASSPTVPLHGSDLSFGIKRLNALLRSYAATGMMLTIGKTESVNLTIGQQNVTTGPSTVSPTPDISVGKIISIENAWLLLDGVTYPLINISRPEFNGAWKYEPLQGLPRFIVWVPATETVSLRLYPAPSQAYEFNVRGKFQLSNLTSNDDMSLLPDYYERYLNFALAKDLAVFKGRMEAWTPLLEKMYQDARDNMVNSSPVNVAIQGDRDSMLNGAWAIRAGI